MASESALPYQMLDARAQSFACSIVIYTTRINDFFACRGLRLPRFDWQYSPPLSVTLVDRSLTCHSRCSSVGCDGRRSLLLPLDRTGQGDARMCNILTSECSTAIG